MNDCPLMICSQGNDLESGKILKHNINMLFQAEDRHDDGIGPQRWHTFLKKTVVLSLYNFHSVYTYILYLLHIIPEKKFAPRKNVLENIS